LLGGKHTVEMAWGNLTEWPWLSKEMSLTIVTNVQGEHTVLKMYIIF
jgi:hypothetical protein